MLCQNCGNKIDDNAYVCVHCGVFLRKRSESNVANHIENNKALSIVSLIIGVFSIFLSLSLFFHDISSVGMYTEIYERVFYAINYSITAIMMASVGLIFSLISKKDTYSSIGLMLSLLSFFFIITEIVVVIIY